MNNEDKKDPKLYEYTIYDAQTGDVLETIIIDQYLGNDQKLK